MKKQTKLLLIFIVIAGLGIAFFANFESGRVTEGVVVKNDESAQESRDVSFNWYFEEAETSNLDGFMKTNIFLSIRRNNIDIEQNLIDTVDGGCYQIEVGEYSKIKCYYAGFGQEYRVVVGEDSYIVEQKSFEEGLPNVVPEDYEWEIVTEYFFL